jgi:hypothetical protein
MITKNIQFAGLRVSKGKTPVLLTSRGWVSGETGSKNGWLLLAGIEKYGGSIRFGSMAKAPVNVRVYYVLPCCLLLLNLVNATIGYQAGRFEDPWVRTLVVMGLVLFGSSLVAFVVAPGLEFFIRWLHRVSRAQAGGLGEALFLIALGAGVFWLYYQLVNHGIESLLPLDWRHV